MNLLISVGCDVGFALLRLAQRELEPHPSFRLWRSGKCSVASIPRSPTSGGRPIRLGLIIQALYSPASERISSSEYRHPRRILSNTNCLHPIEPIPLRRLAKPLIPPKWFRCTLSPAARSAPTTWPWVSSRLSSAAPSTVSAEASPRLLPLPPSTLPAPTRPISSRSFWTARTRTRRRNTRRAISGESLVNCDLVYS